MEYGRGLGKFRRGEGRGSLSNDSGQREACPAWFDGILIEGDGRMVIETG
jgi:hypothetical protein